MAKKVNRVRRAILEKTEASPSVMLKRDEKIGNVFVAQNVVANISAMAATEVEGVYGTANTIPKELLEKFGVKNMVQGVHAVIEGRAIRVTLSLVLEYGYPIPTTSQAVQNKVKTAVENMTGLEVKDINVRIVGIAGK